MKRLTLISYLTSFLVSCTSTTSGKVESKRLEDAFVEDFKTSSFCKCVESGSNQTLDDVSCRYPDYLYSEAQTISNLAKLEGDKIRIDSIRRVGRVAEGMEGKRAIEMCLKFYKSRELDSVARARFKLSEKAMKNAQNN